MTAKQTPASTLTVKIQSTNFVYSNDESGGLEKILMGFNTNDPTDQGSTYMNGTVPLTPEEFDEFPIREMHKAVYKKIQTLFSSDVNTI